ncbi:MAG: VOC family protein [Candidatus Binataceae bacterium]
MPAKAQTARDAAQSITPFLSISDAARAIDFYKKALGAVELLRMEEPDGKVSHAQISIGNSRLMISDPTSEHTAEYRAKGWARDPLMLGGTPVSFYLYVADVDLVVRRAIAAGAKQRDPVQDKEWGDRIGGIVDPFGHVWFIATHQRAVRDQDVAAKRNARVVVPRARKLAKRARRSASSR